jgi:hypothetical protein
LKLRGAILQIESGVKVRLLKSASVIGGRTYREKDEGEEAELKTGCRFITLPYKIGKRVRKPDNTSRSRKESGQMAKGLLCSDGQCQGKI